MVNGNGDASNCQDIRVAVLSASTKIGVFLLIVILGWWISTARTRRRSSFSEKAK